MLLSPFKSAGFCAVLSEFFLNYVGIGLIQQNRQDQHLQRKICIVGADAFISPKP